MYMSGTSWISKDQVIHSLANLRQVTFEVTDACNLACDYCTYRDLYVDHDSRSGKYMSLKTATNLLDYLNSFWNIHPADGIEDERLISFYGGEPLLNMPFIRSVISYLEKLKSERKFRFNMTTNAMLLHKNMDYLADKKIRVLISIDGDEEASGHRHTHKGTSSYQTVKENVLLLKKKYPQYYDKYVSFHSVLHNLNSVESIRKSVFGTFGKYPSISPVNSRGVASDKEKEFDSLYNDYANSYRKVGNNTDTSSLLLFQNPDVKRLHRELSRLTGNFYENYRDLLYDFPESYHPCPGTCTPFSRKLFVTVNGKILQCERIGQNHPLGYVSDTMVDIDPKRVADIYNRMLDKINAKCRTCPGWKICDKCIYYLSENTDGTFDCESFQKEELDRFKKKNREYLSQNPQVYNRLIKELEIK